MYAQIPLSIATVKIGRCEIVECNSARDRFDDVVLYFEVGVVVFASILNTTLLLHLVRWTYLDPS